MRLLFGARIWAIVLLVAADIGYAKTIVVNTADNSTTILGQTNLVQAIRLLQDGDSIHFNIPGPGPHYIVTPPLTPENGYPSITNNNITIDGYSQPGAAPNGNTILSSNNAQIQIVLDSRAGGGHVENLSGYSTHEAAVLMVKGGTNVVMKGLCFLGPGIGGGTDFDPDRYAISFAEGAHAGHINGCWIGLDPDRTNVYRFRAGITAFGPAVQGLTIGVESTAPNASTARGHFNLIIGEYVPIIIEGDHFRISGNFLNVFPDGLTDYNIDGLPPYDVEAVIEFGGPINNLVLGTDGDGLNDAEEKNIFGGVTVASDYRILEWYGGDRTNVVIAGNYFGMGVDGTTRFTNSMRLFAKFNSVSHIRIGSDFDGISDALEQNVIAMNFPFGTLYPTPSIPGPPEFAFLETGAQVSMRGNRLIGNNIAPFSYADGSGGELNAFTNYYAPFVASGELIPALSTNCNQGRLRGSCALGLPPYTNIIIDVYLADEEGWTNGQQFQLAELAYLDPVTSETRYYGFAQGKTYLGSFVDNGPGDPNPAPGQFDFNISSFAIPSTALVTVAANYSADPPGTHNGRVQTSVFAEPITLLSAPVLAIRKSGSNALLSWPTNSGTFFIQFATAITSPSWTNLSPQPLLSISGTNYQASVPIGPSGSFYRLAR